MIILTETTDTIKVVLAGAITTNQLNCLSTYRDVTTSTYTPARTVINTNSTTPVSIVGSPASSTQRVVDTLSVFNADTVSATVTIYFDANGTAYTLFKTVLGTGEKIEYIEGVGFRVFANSGAIKNSINQGNNTVTNSMSAVVLGADVVNSDAIANTIADVTGLSFPVVAGNKYWFKFIIPYTSAVATTGSRWSINGPATTMLNYMSIYTLAATTITTNSASAYDTPAAASATSLTAGNIATIEGIIIPSANGSVIARFASEISASAITAKAGAIVYYQQIA